MALARSQAEVVQVEGDGATDELRDLIEDLQDIHTSSVYVAMQGLDRLCIALSEPRNVARLQLLGVVSVLVRLLRIRWYPCVATEAGLLLCQIYHLPMKPCYAFCATSVLVTLLSSPDIAVVVGAVHLLGEVASTQRHIRDRLLSVDIVPQLLDLVSDNPNAALSCAVLKCLDNLFSYAELRPPAPPTVELVTLCLPAIERLLRHGSVEVIRAACIALPAIIHGLYHFFIDQLSDLGIVQRLADIVKTCADAAAVKAALDRINTIIAVLQDAEDRQASFASRNALAAGKGVGWTTGKLHRVMEDLRQAGLPRALFGYLASSEMEIQLGAVILVSHLIRYELRCRPHSMSFLWTAERLLTQLTVQSATAPVVNDVAAQAIRTIQSQQQNRYESSYKRAENTEIVFLEDHFTEEPGDAPEVPRALSTETSVTQQMRYRHLVWVGFGIVLLLEVLGFWVVLQAARW